MEVMLELLALEVIRADAQQVLVLAFPRLLVEAMALFGVFLQLLVLICLV